MGMIGLLVLVSGCGSGSFLPPPPPELNASPGAEGSAPPKVLDLILDAPDDEDRLEMSRLAHEDAGRRKLSLHVSKSKSPGSAEEQVELIREVLKRGTSVLIVEAIDAPAVVEALNEARTKGIKVLLFDRLVSSPGNGAPFTLVTFASFRKAAKEIVDGMIADAKRSALPLKGPALLVANDRGDNHSNDRLAALKDALKEAGIPLIDTVSFHLDSEKAEAALKPKVEANPKLVYVLADEDHGMAGVYTVIKERPSSSTVLMGGFVSYDSRLNPRAIQECSAVVDRNLRGLVRRMMETAVSLSDGETVPDRIEVPLPFHGLNEASGTKATPKTPAK